MDLHFLASTGEGAWAVDAQQRIIYWNLAAEKLFGYKAQDVLGRFCYDLLSGSTADQPSYCHHQCPIYHQAQAHEKIAPLDLLITDAQGQQHPMNISTLAIPDPDSKEETPIIVHLARTPSQKATTDTRLQIRLFGHMSVQKADNTFANGPLWQRIKVQALFALFLSMHGNPISRDLLIENLWPDMDRAAALRNLNTAVYNLRRTLEPHLKQGNQSHHIRYQEQAYFLANYNQHWLDVHQFEQGVQHARRTPNPADAITLYQSTLSLYQGDFLSHLNTAVDWHLNEQERLHNLYLTALQEMAALLEQQTQFDKATETYNKIITLDSCHETAVQALMHLALTQNDRITAIIHYRRFQKALKKELGLSPNAQTEKLYQSAHN